MKISLRQGRNTLAKTVFMAAWTAPLVLIAPTARAQFDGSAYSFPVPDYVSGAIASSTLSNTYSSGKGKSKGQSSKKSKASTAAKPKPVSVEQRRKLLFVPSQAVTQQSNQAFASYLEGKVPHSRQEILAKLNDGSFSKLYRKITVPCQLSTNNLADAITAYMVVSWGVLNKKPNVGRPLDRAGTKAVQQSVTRQIVRDPKMMALSSTQKQMLTEHLSHMTTLYVMTNADLRAKKDQGALAGFRAEVRDASRKRVGVDLSKVRFSSKGFAA